jgi:lambda repressor-like predicted transcriptional regulator
MTTSGPTTVLGRAQAQPRTHGEARLVLLRERGISLSDVARDLGRTVSVVSRVNRAQRRSQAIEQDIARRLGLSLEDAFPERYRVRNDGRQRNRTASLTSP